MQTEPNQKRKQLFTYFALGVGFIGLISFAYWFFIASNHVVTDSAYAAADIAQVTPAIAGTVKAVNVVDTQKVKAGDVLIVLDDNDTQLSLKEAEANLAHSSADLERAQSNFDRRKKLATSGYVSGEDLANAESTLKIANATFASAGAKVTQAKIDLERTVIRAPIDGVIAKRDVQLGQRVVAGAHLLSVVPIAQIYVNANFKEVQLRNVKIGQPVEVYADLYGSGVVYRGRVVGLAGGTGSAFAVIPAQNATGNWIKVVQRLPVRIALDADTLQKYPLQVGLSMHADIKINGKIS
jgi:membrane fusion protein (multidrug efflux system)